MRKKGKDEEETPRRGDGPTSRKPSPRSTHRASAGDRVTAGRDRPRIRVTHGTPGLPGAESGSRARPKRSAVARPTLDRARPFATRPPAGPKKPARAANDEALEAPRRPSAIPPKRRSVAPSSSGTPRTPGEPSTAAKELALAIAGAGLDKKAVGIEVLDVTGRVDYADYLVIMTGSSDRHVHAIASGIEEALTKKKHRPLSVEGLGAGTWVLLDFDDVVVHVFQEESRRLYDIEGLWMDARRIEVAEPSAAPAREPQRPRS